MGETRLDHWSPALGRQPKMPIRRILQSTDDQNSRKKRKKCDLGGGTFSYTPLDGVYDFFPYICFQRTPPWPIRHSVRERPQRSLHKTRRKQELGPMHARATAWATQARNHVRCPWGSTRRSVPQTRSHLSCGKAGERQIRGSGAVVALVGQWGGGGQRVRGVARQGKGVRGGG